MPNDMIFSGEVRSSIIWSHDLGTFEGTCTIHIDSIYRSDEILFKKEEITLSAIRYLNDTSPEFYTFWEQLKGKHVVVFASGDSQNRLEWEKELLIQEASKLTEEEQSLLTTLPKVKIEFGPQVPPEIPCEVCQFFEIEEDEKVLQLLKKEVENGLKSKGYNELNFAHHPCVKWVLTPDAVLASLPSYATTILVLDNGRRKKELYYKIQLGEAAGRFGIPKEDVDAQKLLQIAYQDSLLDKWCEAHRYGLSFSDAADDASSYPRMAIPDEWLLLRKTYDVANSHHYYNMHPTQEYIWDTSLTALEKDSNIFDLCLLTQHPNVNVSLKSLDALKRLKDLRAVPYLLALLQFQIDITDQQLDTQNKQSAVYNIRKHLLETLDSCLDVRVYPTIEYLENSVVDDVYLRDCLQFFRSKLLNSDLKSF